MKNHDLDQTSLLAMVCLAVSESIIRNTGPISGFSLKHLDEVLMHDTAFISDVDSARKAFPDNYVVIEYLKNGIKIKVKKEKLCKTKKPTKSSKTSSKLVRSKP